MSVGAQTDGAARALEERHLKALFGGLRAGGLDFHDLYRECLERSATSVADSTWYLRPQRALHLAQSLSDRPFQARRIA